MKSKLDKKFSDVTKEMKERDYNTLYSEYTLAIKANRQLSDALDKEREENDRLRVLIFAFVRNSAVAPTGFILKKSEQEITDKTFETIQEAEKMIDFDKMKDFMNLASAKENRFDKE